jgi:hypothetical protein
MGKVSYLLKGMLMKIKKILLISCLLGFISHVSAEEFTKTGSINFNQTFYGNSGKYKTTTSHPALTIDYNFSPQWNIQLEWNRTWNMYHYTGEVTQQDNSYGAPELNITNTYGKIGSSNVEWSSNFLAKYENDYNNTSQTFLMAQTSFDFSNYIPQKKYFNITQFAISPIYYYGWNTSGASGHTNTAVLSLLTNIEFSSNLSFIFNAYGLRSWNQGSSFLTNPNNKSETTNYFMVISYLNYAKEIYKFNDKTSVNFNFVTGLDPWISSNKQTTVEPFLVGEEMYEWLSPTEFNGTYHNTFTFFAMPQIEFNYQLSQKSFLNFFIQTKYSNQIWGENEKAWKFQPQGGFGITHNF